MIKRLLLLIPLCVLFCLTGSAEHKDSIRIDSSFRMFAPRMSLSYQKSILLGIGLSFHKYHSYRNISEFGTEYFGPYLALDILPRSDKIFFFPKIGYEFAGISTASTTMYLGIDASYLNHGEYKTACFTPKLGFSFIIFELCYGYSFFRSNEFERYLSHSKCSLIINLNKKYWKQIDNTEKRYR